MQVASRARQQGLLEWLARQLGLTAPAHAGVLPGDTTATGAQNPCALPAEALAFALECTARRCLSRLAMQYGERLRDVVNSARAKPAYGSALELQGLLNAVLSCQELS